MAKISDEKLEELKSYPLSYRLKRLRTMSGYTQKQAASLMGVHQQSICCWETEVQAPIRRMLEKYIELYELPIDYFDDIEIERLKLKKGKD